jgi:hypothetical protein
MDPSQAPAVVQQPNMLHSTSSQYLSSEIPPSVNFKYDTNNVPILKPRVCGLSPAPFWAVIIVLVIIVAAALGGGIGGGLATKAHSGNSGPR